MVILQLDPSSHLSQVKAQVCCPLKGPSLALILSPEVPGVIYVCVLSHVRLMVTPWTVACRNPLSMGFSRQEYWSGLPFLSPGHLPHSGIEPESPALAGRFFTSEPPGKPLRRGGKYKNNCHLLGRLQVQLYPSPPLT